MKWPKDQVEIILDGFKQFFENSQLDVSLVKEKYKENITPALWQLWRSVVYDLQYDNNHPAYQPGEIDGFPRPPRKRLVKYNPKFVLYPKGCYDDHLLTMIKHVAKQIGLM